MVKKKQLILCVILFLFLPVVSFAAYDCGDPAACTVTCDGTNDNTDINSAIAAANLNSTITIGSATCDIAGTVTIDRAVTLSGTGSDPWGTVFSGSASPMIDVTHNSGFARVTKIKTTSSVTYFIKLSGTILFAADPQAGVRIDNNYCEDVAYCIFSSGRVEGVIDNNEFVNCERCFYAGGTDHSAWEVGFDDYSGGSGTGNFLAGIDNPYMLFVEDNTFTRDNSYARGDEQVHYTQEGARTVFRYNSVDMSAWTFNGVVSHDSHGNQKYYNEAGTFRGQPIHEIYENTYAVYRPRWNGQTFDLRSGSNIIFNNTITITYTTTEEGVIEFWEEEAESGAGRHFTDPGFDYIWPTEDMVTNTFIWGNTIDGAALTKSNVSGNDWEFAKDCCGDYPDAGSVINFDRDIWMHAPESSGGRTYYDDRPGASGRDADGTLVFTQSGANAYYPYTPYTYPHPLASPQLTNPTTNNGWQTCNGISTVRLQVTSSENAWLRYCNDADVGCDSATTFDDMVPTFDTPNATTHTEDLAALTCSTSYTFWVRASDASGEAGNENSVSTEISFTTAEDPGGGTTIPAVEVGSNTVINIDGKRLRIE